MRDSLGRLAPVATIVRFSRIGVDGNEVAVKAIDGTSFGDEAASPTDGSGRTAVFLRLGTKAGVASILVTVPVLGFADTIQMTAVAAAPSVIQADGVGPILEGGSVQLAARMFDQYGNPVDRPIAWRVTEPGGSVSSSAVFSSQVGGSYTVVASHGDLAFNMRVRVVPDAEIVGISFGRIVTVRLDGSQRKNRAEFLTSEGVITPAFIPGTRDVLFSTWSAPNEVVMIGEENGTVRPLVSPLPSGMSHHVGAVPTRDGSWIYFRGWNNRCFVVNIYCLHRVKKDGSQLQLLDAGVGAASLQHVAPSPDGRSVALSYIDEQWVIRLLNLSQGGLSSWRFAGKWPTWSPTGDRIAFVQDDGRIMVARADGSGQPTVLASPGYPNVLDWSPDGRWILTAGALVRVSDGHVISLEELWDVSQAHWKRD